VLTQWNTAMVYRYRGVLSSTVLTPRSPNRGRRSRSRLMSLRAPSLRPNATASQTTRLISCRLRSWRGALAKTIVLCFQQQGSSLTFLLLHTHTHYSPSKAATIKKQIKRKKKKRNKPLQDKWNTTGQHNSILGLIFSTQSTKLMILWDMESLRRKLDLLLLMHTEGSGKLNISMLWSRYVYIYFKNMETRRI